MNNRITQIVSLIITLILMIPFTGMAQGPADPGGDPSTPIDGGVSLLAGAAAVYGVKKLKDRKKMQASKKDEGE